MLGRVGRATGAVTLVLAAALLSLLPAAETRAQAGLFFVPHRFVTFSGYGVGPGAACLSGWTVNTRGNRATELQCHGDFVRIWEDGNESRTQPIFWRNDLFPSGGVRWAVEIRHRFHDPAGYGADVRHLGDAFRGFYPLHPGKKPVWSSTRQMLTRSTTLCRPLNVST